MADATTPELPPASPLRRPWHAPELRCLGSFTELTQCSGGQPSPDLLLGRTKVQGHSTC